MFHKVEAILGLQLESSIKIVVRFFIWSDALIVSWSGWLVFLLVTSVSKTCKFQPLFFIQGEERQKFHTLNVIEELSHRGNGAKRLKVLILSSALFDALMRGVKSGARISSYQQLIWILSKSILILRVIVFGLEDIYMGVVFSVVDILLKVFFASMLLLSSAHIIHFK